MSHESVDQFFNAARQDAILLIQLEECYTEDAFLRTAVRLGADLGLEFTAQDIRQSLAPAIN